RCATIRGVETVRVPGIGSSVWRQLAAHLPLRVVRRLPVGARIPILAWRAGPRAGTAGHRTIELQDPLTLHAYWLRSSHGTSGPAASVHLGIEELLRIDGLRGECHVHYDLAASRARRTPGIAARRPVADDDIAAWAAGELRHNLRYALSQDRRRAVRRLELDDARLTAAGDELVEAFEALLERFGDETSDA
ncbi:MAG: hypothetical protein AAGA17_16065, partial [Actinomycetota bacterium]